MANAARVPIAEEIGAIPPGICRRVAADARARKLDPGRWRHYAGPRRSDRTPPDPPDEACMPSFTLTDLARDLWVESFAIDGAAVGLPASPAWSVAKRVLRGGRRDGVDLIRVDNGAFAFAVVPTRGMGIWRGSYEGDRVGWDSPVRDGPVHPAHVNLMEGGGLGWLGGFDELLVRCGLEN